ncbi:hypothetical protein [Agrococcus sp. Marseille-Q4369]|uniref:hypothetical protein n=1 Tax=Agrococcus sp. Marseille-Q4369 TaxID=2810513 RepID=UPI001B8B26CF|nr:hypothetical protein [Agrococcus sp. Marseille-Q4369]QUW18210.1 hypothetical protein JSQ78_10285 [Agrococcus sp. Marseille-Q4369]
MTDPFDDPDVRAEMERLGIVHRPGMAEELMQELAPLLAAEGVDLDEPAPELGLDALNAALSRATEQHNLMLFTPVGAQRAGALRLLEQFSVAVADGDAERVRSLIASTPSQPAGSEPAVSHVIGAALGVLDSWSGDAAGARALAAARVPRWADRRVRASATDIVALARKGRAFDALTSLHARHRGLAVHEGACLALAAAIAARAAHEQSTVEATAARVLADSADASAPTPVTGSAFRKPQPSSAGPSAEAADRALGLELGRWLRREHDYEPAEAATATRAVAMVFELARLSELDPHDAADVDLLIDVLVDARESQDARVVDVLIDALDDYLHFRIETADAPQEWKDVHDYFEEATAEDGSPASDAIGRALDAAASIPREVRQEALARTRVIEAVPALLEWIGKGRPITPSGALRRADIQDVARLLGIDAVGVSSGPRQEPIVRDPAVMTAAARPEDAVEAMSMLDVPMLDAWWEALLTAEVIETTASRVRPGPQASRWATGSPPPEDAEMLAGAFVAHAVTWEARLARGYYNEEAVAETIRRLLLALPRPDGDGADERSADQSADTMFAPRALRMLRQLVRAGLLQVDESRELAVPAALASVVARGAVLALTIIDIDDELDD